MRLNWGIIGAGAIAKALVVGAKSSRTASVAAVASRELAKARAFAGQHGIPAAYGSYEQLLQDRNVQAVYVCTPHPMHAQWVIAALEAGKHVLCEKPFTVNYHEATKLVDLAREKGLMLMEAFMYRCHPQTAKVVELLRQQVIGEVRVIQATFSFNAGFFSAESRLFNNDLAGGGIMDVGCYSVSYARLIAGAAMGEEFAQPVQVKGVGHLGQTGVDEWAIASLKFPGDILAQLATGVSVNHENVVRIHGTKGQILVPNPWVANRDNAEQGKVIIRPSGQEAEELLVPADRTSFSYELDLFANAIENGTLKPAHPAMSLEDTLGNMATLDAWRREVGLTYEMEKPQNYTHTHSRKPLAVKPNGMLYGSLPRLDKKVSRLVMGVDNQVTIAHASTVFDEWFERGGTAFDTAFIYCWGECERMLGWWMKNRGVREEVVIIDKGAHTPFCDPESITTQLMQSLDRLQSDYVDVYLMHRDNLEVPVGEFVDVLNEHLRAGRIRVFGGSNWTLERIDEANAYAQSKGLRGFELVSNNFSLARMVNMIWDGSFQTADAASRKWFTERHIPLLPWSSQARGFFLDGVAAPDKRDNAEMVRAWYAEDNFLRLERARELAKKKGCQAINIALAYVLCQPFPTFPLIGPRNIFEIRSSLRSLEIQLSPEELAWLNLDA